MNALARKLVLAFGISAIVFLIGMIGSLKSCYNVRVEFDTYKATQEQLAEQQKKENDLKATRLATRVIDLETQNAQANAKLSDFDDELARLRARQARAKRAIQAPASAKICANAAENDRLAEAVSSYTRSVNDYRSAVRRFERQVLGGYREAQRQTNTLIACQSWIRAVQNEIGNPQ